MALTVRWAPAGGVVASCTVRLPASGRLDSLVTAVRDAFAPALDSKVRANFRAPQFVHFAPCLAKLACRAPAHGGPLTHHTHSLLSQTPRLSR